MLTGTEVTADQLVALRRPPGATRSPQAFAHQVGQRESRLAGTGLQMRELRNYRAGDDLRHVHWKATARLGEPLTKVFEAENELSWLMVIILTPDMYFGSQQAFKSVRALEAAALLAWERLALNDAVGSLICSPHGLEAHAPTRTRQGLLRQLAIWAEHSRYQANLDWPEDAFESLITELQYLGRPHRPMVVFSDFLPPFDWHHLFASTAAYPTTLVQLYDPLERNIPTRGSYPVAESGNTHWVQGSSKASVRYLNARHDWFRSLYRQFSRSRNRWVTLGTEQDPATWSWQAQEASYGR